MAIKKPDEGEQDMSWTGNTCEKGRFWGIQGISGHCVVKFLVVALVLLIGAGCNLQVRKNGKSGLRSLPRATQDKPSQVHDSKEVVIVSSDSIGKDKPISVEPDPEPPSIPVAASSLPRSSWPQAVRAKWLDAVARTLGDMRL